MKSALQQVEQEVQVSYHFTQIDTNCTLGMELLAMNLVEEGDIVCVGVNGVFGGRIKEICEKLKGNTKSISSHILAKVFPMEVPYGEGITTPMLQDTIQKAGGKVDIVWVVHAETSTGKQEDQFVMDNSTKME